MNNKDNEYVLPENLAKKLAKRGATIEISNEAEQNRQNSLWYGGTVATIKYKGLVFEIAAVGDVIAELLDKPEGERMVYVKDKGNNAVFYSEMISYIKDDEGLQKAVEENRLIVDYGNWWEVITTDEHGDQFCGFEGVIDGVLLTDAIDEVTASLDWWYKNYLEERAEVVAYSLIDEFHSVPEASKGVLTLPTMVGNIGVEAVENKIKFYDSDGCYLDYIEECRYSEEADGLFGVYDLDRIHRDSTFIETFRNIATSETVDELLRCIGCRCFTSEDIEDIAAEMSRDSSGGIEFTVEEAMENEFVNRIGDTYILMKE